MLNVPRPQWRIQHLHLIIWQPFSNVTNEGNLRSLHKQRYEALHAAEILQQQGVSVSQHHVYHLLQECVNVNDADCGRRAQSFMVRGGLDSVPYLSEFLIRLFASHETLVESNEAFEKVKKPSMYTWGAIISAHAKLGQGKVALQLYHAMQLSGVESNKHIYLPALKVCINISAIDQAKIINAQIIRDGLQSDLILGNTIVDTYAKCGSLEEAREIFDLLPTRSVVSWGAMIAGYAEHAEGFLALECFNKMQESGIDPNEATLLSVLKACSRIQALEQGRKIHKEVVKNRMQSDVAVGNALVDMYAKCWSYKEARQVFDNLPHRDIVSWNTMVAGYAQNGEGLLGLQCFVKMQQLAIKPDKVTFSSILKACGSIGAIEQGKDIHKQIIGSGLHLDVIVGNTLADMYAKCGKLKEAHDVIKNLPKRDIASWGTIIAGYAQCGDFKLAAQCLEDMQKEGIKPNGTIFTSIFTVCSHAGLVNEGCIFFKSMMEDHGLKPKEHHCSCLIDLLGRAGYLNEAEGLLLLAEKAQPSGPDIIGWKSLLTACSTYGNVELGRRCFERIVQLDPHHASGYMLMSGVFSDAQMWKDAAKIEKIRQCAKAQKKPARAWIEVNKKVHEFIVGDRSHPQSEDIYAMLKKLSNQLKREGYIPKVDLVLQHMSDEDKENALCGHAEKLAIAFGFISTPPGTTIQATKNLRMCTNCHDATKIISKIEKREIIVRDAYCIHRFKDGYCSCLH